MSMEIMLRYIVGIAIAYGIGKWIYQSIRSRSIDYFLLAIIALMGAVLWLSRGFLISNRVYDFLMIVVWLVAVGCFIISRNPIWQVFEICYCWRSFYFSCAFCLLECKSGVYQTDNIDNSAEGIFNK